MTPRVAWGVAVAASLSACKGKSEPTPSGQPSASIPRVHVSAQPSDPAAALASAKPAVETDGTERAAGAGMHASVNRQCSDSSSGTSQGGRQCMFDKCAAQCTQWMKETRDASAYRGPNHKNQVYINCTGSCMSGKAQP